MNGVTIKAAAAAVDMDVPRFRVWMQRSREQREEDPAWVHEIAVVVGTAHLSKSQTVEDEIYRRAILGTEEEVFYQGKVVGSRIKHDNKLLLTVKRQLDPAWREDKTNPDAGRPGEGMTKEELFAAFTRMQTIDAAREKYRELAEEQGLLPGQVTIEGRAVEVPEARERGKRLTYAESNSAKPRTRSAPASARRTLRSSPAW